MPHDLRRLCNMPCLRLICTRKSLRPHATRHEAGCSTRFCVKSQMKHRFRFWPSPTPRTRKPIDFASRVISLVFPRILFSGT
jgi:hypothetical protein